MTSSNIINAHISNLGNANKIRIENNNTWITSQDWVEKGIQRLSLHVAASAVHNSKEISKAPLYHPNTRTDVQASVLDWLHSPQDELCVTWMHGPAGSGKSTIARTLAKQCNADRRLAASFFFSRTIQGRDNENMLISTLAYHLSLNVPATRQHIAEAVMKHPLFSEGSLEQQMDLLLVSPLLMASPSIANTPLLFVVDGLDECDEDLEDLETPEWESDTLKPREVVIDGLLSGFKTLHDNGLRTVKLLITSRSDHDIRRSFKDHPLSRTVRRLQLNDKWNADNDIRTYLIDKLDNIKGTHTFFQSFVNRSLSWPSASDVDKLVLRSSGQFIYASVVINYIRSFGNPKDRLEVVLGLQTTTERPYARLDALYRYIFSRIPNIEKSYVLEILSLQRMYSRRRKQEPLSTFMSKLLGMDVNQIKHHLRHLLSILQWEGDGFQLMHASLPEFLLDQERSGQYFINSKRIAVAIVERCRTLLADRSKFTKTLHRIRPVLDYYSKELNPSDRIDIFKLAADFDVIDLWRRLKRGAQRCDNVKPIAKYIRWMVLALESQETPNEGKSILEGSMMRISLWVNDAMNNCCIQSLGKSEGIDLWPFFAVKYYSYLDSDPIRPLSKDIASMLEICQLSTPTLQDILDQEPDELDQTILLWYLLPQVVLQPQAHYGKRLLGPHTFTKEQYTVSFVRVCRYLVYLLPRETLSDLLSGFAFAFNPDVPHAARFAAKAFSIFINQSTVHVMTGNETGLCLFVVYVQSVLMRYTQSSKLGDHFSQDGGAAINSNSNERTRVPDWEAKGPRGVRMLASTRHYLNKMQKLYPALHCPGSLDLAQLQHQAETSSWIGIVSDFWNPRMYIEENLIHQSEH